MKNFVTLRNVEEDDLAMLLRWRNAPEVRSYMYTQHEIQESEHFQWFKRSKSNPDRHLLLVEEGGKPFGFVNIYLLDCSAKRADWGFYISPEASKGSGSDLGYAALSYAFQKLQLHKLCGEALAVNIRSRRFHERLGFKQEACLRDHYFDGVHYQDVIGYGLLRHEWREFQENRLS